MPCYRVEVDVEHGAPDFGGCRVARVIRRLGDGRTFYVACDSATALALSDQPGVVWIEETSDADCASDPSPS
jgi:hypothetical protein